MPELKTAEKKKQVLREHEKLKLKIGTLAQKNGFRIVYEEETKDGGRVDVGLHNSKYKIACEISVTNTVEYEVKNINKCLIAKYDLICVTSPIENHLQNIKERAQSTFSMKELKKMIFLSVVELEQLLKDVAVKPGPNEKVINGYRVKVKYSDTNSESMEDTQKKIAKIILNRKSD